MAEKADKRGLVDKVAPQVRVDKRAPAVWVERVARVAASQMAACEHAHRAV